MRQESTGRFVFLATRNWVISNFGMVNGIRRGGQQLQNPTDKFFNARCNILIFNLKHGKISGLIMNTFINPIIYKYEYVEINGMIGTDLYIQDVHGRDRYETSRDWEGAISLDE